MEYKLLPMRLILIFVLCCPLVLIGQEKKTFESDLQTEKKPWTHLDFADDPNNFQFAIISDRTGGPRPGVFEDAVKKLNWLMPEFVISVGDLIRGASGKDVKKLDKQWEAHFERIAPLKMPFFHLAGNHDIKANNQFQVDYWNEQFGAAYYSFVYKNVLFLNLFTNEGTQVIGDEQIAYFKQVIEENPNVRWTMVFMHHPLWRYTHNSNFGKIEALLKDREYTVFAGHQHRYHHSVKDNKNYYVLATTGGGSELLGNSFGTFDHVTWITMSDEGPILANLRLDGILPHNVANEESHQLTQNLLQNVFAETMVLIDSETQFNQGTAYITYSNKSDFPLYLTSRFFHSHHLIVNPEKIKEEIAPHSSKTIAVALQAIKLFDLKENIQIELTGSIGYQLEDYPDLAIEGSVFIPIKNEAKNLISTEEAEFVGSYRIVMNDLLPNTAIRYTLDGSDPTTNSLLYSQPFEVSKELTIKARLFNKDGLQQSAIDQLKVKPIQPGQGCWVELYTYDQVGKSWGGLDHLNSLSPKKIKTTLELDPIKVAGRSDQFALVYKGAIDLPEEGQYLFKAFSDDGIRVLIDGAEVLADPIKHKAREATGTAILKAGKHDIEIQYFQWKRKYALQLTYVTPSGKEREITAKTLSYD